MYQQDVTNSPPGTGNGSGQGGVQDKARQAGDAAKEGAQEVAGTVKEQGREVAREARDQVRGVASDVRRSVSGQARTQNQRLADGLRQMSDQFAGMGPGDDTPAGQVVRRLGEGGRRAADYLEDRGPEGVLDDVQEFARRKPGTFLLIAAAAGFVVGRLGRAAVAASQDDDPAAGRSSRLTGSGLPGPDAYPEGDGVYRSASATETGAPPAMPAEAYPDTAATGYPGTGMPTGMPSAPPAAAAPLPPVEPAAYPVEPNPPGGPR